MKAETWEQADIPNRIYDILETVGASPAYRADFLYWFIANDGNEYRFQGIFGFGGKFWKNDGHWYINCYSEDLTEERQAKIGEVNRRLQELMGHT